MAHGHRHPKEPLPGILADPTADAAEVKASAEDAVAALAKTIVGVPPIGPTDLAAALRLRPPARTRQQAGKGSIASNYFREIGGKVQLPAFSETVPIRSSVPVRAWLVHDLAWLYPDDPTLWRLAIESARANERLLIVCRKIAPATFHLLKLLGIRGIQYYSVLCARTSDAIRGAFDGLGLPHLLNLQDLTVHPVRAQARASIAALGDQPPPNAKRAIEEAEARGFGDSSPPTPAALIDWSAAIDADWPPIWQSMLEAWRDTQSTRVPVAAAEVNAESSYAPSAENSEAEQPSPARQEEQIDFRESVVSRSRVAAEVDRETWDRLRVRATKAP